MLSYWMRKTGEDFATSSLKIRSIRSELVVGEIVQVFKVNVYKCCRVCHCKAVEKSELTAECPKCNSRVKLGKCPSTSSARFVIEDDAGLTTLVTAFGDTVADITEGSEDIEDKLLNTPKQKYFFTLKN